MDAYNSMIGGNFAQPLANAVHSLVRENRESVDSKVNERDTDWILTGILLSAVMFESHLRWTHVHKYPNLNNKEGPDFYDYLRTKHPELPDVGEIFLLRNVIVHGHVWEIGAPSASRRFLAKLLRGWKDQRWRRYVKDNARVSKSGFNLPPSLMNRQDFRMALNYVVGAMRALANAELLLVQPLERRLIWPDGSGERIRLEELVERIR